MTDTSPFTLAYALTAIGFVLGTALLLVLPYLISRAHHHWRNYQRLLEEIRELPVNPSNVHVLPQRRAAR